MGSKEKGSRGERELVNFLIEDGWWPMRAPSSGSATEADLPDVIAGKGGTVIALEAKYWESGTHYLDQEKVKALLRFSREYGAIPLGAFRYNGVKTWYFQNPMRLPTTKSGNQRVKQEEAMKFPTLEQLDQLIERNNS